MKLILLNGAPRSGKDTSALALEEHIENPVIFERFSRPIKEAFAGLMAAEIDEHCNVAGYENDKEKLIPLLGVSYRQWQIDFSERFMKPFYGERIFGKLLLCRLAEYEGLYPPEDYEETVVVVPDCGFQIELDTLVSEFPVEDILLVRLSRPGGTFDNDSRSVVEPTRSMRCVDIVNDSTVQDLQDTVLKHVRNFVSPPAALGAA